MSNETMTHEEIMKALTQVKHRLEETQARDQVKKRKERTRRLIIEGAILEKYVPAVRGIPEKELERFMQDHLDAAEAIR